MKLTRMKQFQSRFQIPYKIYKDDQEISQLFQQVSNQCYQAIVQYFIFEDGRFDYSYNQRESIIATVNKEPFVFIVDGPFICEQIPFETKIDISDGHVFVSGVFAIAKSSIGQYDQMKKDFEKRIKDDLLKQIEKQKSELEELKKVLQ